MTLQSRGTMLLLSGFMLVGCKTGSPSSSGVKDTDTQMRNLAATVNSVNRVGTGLLAKVPANTDGNRFISPLSVHTALSLIAEGASGDSLKQLETLMGDSIENIKASNVALTDVMLGTSDYKMEMANSLWVAKGVTIDDIFSRRIARHYEAKSDSVDFADPKSGLTTVNQWIATHAKGLLSPFSSLDPQTRMMIINATYFEAKWTTWFSDVGPEKFTMANKDKEVKTVPFLRMTHFHKFVKHDGSYKAVAKPYGQNGDAAMIIVRPDGDLSSFISSMTADSWKSLSAEVMAAEKQMVKFQMPKVSFRYEAELSPMLQALEVKEMFTDGARFDKISKEPLKVSFINHKNYIRVNETGTIAASATSSGFAAGAAGPEETIPEMICDKPYLFAIVDAKSGATLFFAAIENPVDIAPAP